MYLRYDPDEWRPSEPGRNRTTTGRLEPDAIVAWERKPYRVIEVRERPHVDWPEAYKNAWAEHGMPDPETWNYRPRVIVMRREDEPKGKRVNLQGPNSTYWHVLPEHYSICRLCHELPPCRHVHTEAVMERASDRMAEQMALMPGVCHACREPITRRQKSFTFPGSNLIRPDLGDDSAVFHTRGKCSGALDSYDKRWADAEPGRVRFFYCDGTSTVHHDGTTECDNPECAAKKVAADLVGHKARIWHHPRGSYADQGCWCLVSAAA